ncbi:MAG: response regulator receiver protein [Chloroflexi bacterium]|nr:MAG: response regulator receiver protein [Chloroflexota bacterium]
MVVQSVRDALVAPTKPQPRHERDHGSDLRYPTMPHDEVDNHYRTFVERLPVVAYIADVRDTFEPIYIGSRISELTGYPCDALAAGRVNRLALVHPDDRERVRANDASAMALQEAFAIEYRIVRRDGTLRWVLDQASIVSGNASGQHYWHGYLQDITERKAAEDRLREAEFKHRSLVEANPAVIYSEPYPCDHSKLFLGPRIVELCGFTREEWLARETMWEDLLHPDDRAWAIAANDHSNATGEPFRAEYRWIHRDGRVVWIHDECVLVRADDGGPMFWQGVFVDITERKRMEEELREAEQRYRLLVEQIPAIVYTEAVDAGSPLVYISRQVEALLGYPPELWLSRPGMWRSVMHPDDRERIFAERERAYAMQQPYAMEYRLFAADGRIVWIHDEALLVRDGADIPRFWQGIAVDITPSKRLEEELAWRAFHDPLTGLPNRALFLDRLRQACSRATAPHRRVALIFFDLDNLKVINDSLGHAAGDSLLRLVAERLLVHIHPPATLARLGGDEFTVLLEDVDAAEDALRLAWAIEQALTAPFSIAGREMFVSASLGIALSTPNMAHPDDLLRDADMAMYRAKSSGKARCEVFDPSMNAQAVRRLELENDLRRALERDELFIVYQPKVDLSTGRTIAQEALVRWRHPQRGLLMPGEFIPIAEETGLIVPIGHWMLREVCRQARRWTGHPGQAHLVTSVNLSGRQFQHPYLAEAVLTALDTAGLDPARLALEVTESVVMDDVTAAVETLRRLKQLGIHIGIDDFGTGYSSLAYLRRFPVDFLKIDKSFVAELESDTEAAVIVSAMIGLAHALGLRVVAEGIETPAQLGQLRELGCDYGQGYYFSRPVRPEAVQPHYASSLAVA